MVDFISRSTYLLVLQSQRRIVLRLGQPVREDHVVGTWRRADDIDAFANMIGVLLGEDCTSIEFEINRINF